MLWFIMRLAMRGCCALVACSLYYSAQRELVAQSGTVQTPTQMEEELKKNPENKRTLVPALEKAILKELLTEAKTTGKRFRIPEIKPMKKLYAGGSYRIIIELFPKTNVAPAVTVGRSQMFLTGTTAPTLNFGESPKEPLEFTGSFTLQHIDGSATVLLEYDRDSVPPFVNSSSGGVRVSKIPAGALPSGNGTIYRFSGQVPWMEHMFVCEGDDLSRLTFALTNEFGLVYLRGVGKVILKNGKEIPLGR
jgi:hypothetical protein